MTRTKFVQIHFLTPFPASLLNRDDAGMAKRIPFGGTSRIRISSQCLKRHWRTASGEHSLAGLGIEMSVRSKRIFDELIAEPLIKEGLDPGVVRRVTKALQDEVLGKSEKAAAQKTQDSNDKNDTLETKQVIILGKPEIEFLKTCVRELARKDNSTDHARVVKDYLNDKDRRKNLDALKKGASAGLDAALFGRMVTSDILARGDAAIHVAHAFTVHQEEAEIDFFSAVDDLAVATGELGSGHINESELTSGLYYGYAVVDIPLLVSNLEGVPRDQWEQAPRKLASRVVERLIHLIATVSPGAKRGSTAPYSYADLMLVETGSSQPRTLANAFLDPVRADAPGGLRRAAVNALSRHLEAYDRMYQTGESRGYACLIDETQIPAEKMESLHSLALWAAAKVHGEKP